MAETIVAERRDHVLWITIDRPERRNALDDAMMDRLTELFEGLPQEDDTRLVVIRGAGRTFSAGGDIKDIAPILAMSPEQRSAHFRTTVRNGPARAFTAMSRVPQPILLSVRGHAIGAAAQMAAVADLLIASETARFTIPQVDLAHTVDHGESWFLPRKVGLAVAKRMCLMGEPLDAAGALAAGLASWVVPDDALDARTDEIAARLASRPPVALRGMKALLDASLRQPDLAAQLAMEEETIGRATATADFVEAINGFIEKRAPVFTGR